MFHNSDNFKRKLKFNSEETAHPQYMKMTSSNFFPLILFIFQVYFDVPKPNVPFMI